MSAHVAGAPRARNLRKPLSVAAAVMIASCGAVFAQDAETPSEPMTITTTPSPAPTATPQRKRAPAPRAATPERTAAPEHAAAPEPAASGQLPHGASSVTESYGDWTVSCKIDNGQKLCTMAQTQGNKDTGQRTFGIELRPPKDGRSDGVILMPFGLKLEVGGILKLDDKDLGKGLRFSTCVPEGCLLPLSLPTVATDAMKTSKVLTAASLNLSNGQAVAFNISLKGFGPALDRVAELAK